MLMSIRMLALAAKYHGEIVLQANQAEAFLPLMSADTFSYRIPLSL